MNLEAINKWLDEEYGCFYTRLEELHDFYFEKYNDLQQENQQLKERVNYLERSNDRREDTILEQRQEISNLEDNRNKLKKWIDIEISENRDSEDLLKLYVELQEDNEKLLSRIRGFKNQQKEFIEYINEKIDICDGFIDTIRSDLEEISYGGRSCGKQYIANEIMKNEVAKKILEEILSKYKEIIGDDK